MHCPQVNLFRHEITIVALQCTDRQVLKAFRSDSDQNLKPASVVYVREAVLDNFNRFDT